MARKSMEDMVGDMIKKRPKMHLKLKKGALHKEMGVKAGEKIPVEALEEEKKKGGLAAKRAQFALNARKWSHAR